MNDFKIHTETIPDPTQLIEFMQKIDDITQKDSYVKLLTSIAKHHILAYKKRELLGWLAMVEINPATMFLFEWHPFVHQHPQQNEIKQKLLHEAFILTKNSNIPNLRTFIPVKNPDSYDFRELEKLYYSAGMTKTHIQYCMECQISVNKDKAINFPPDLIIEDLNTVDREKLFSTYEIVFKDAFDDFINSLDDFERKTWDLFQENQIPNVAAVLIKQGKIIGFIGVHDEGEYVEIGPVGIVPEFQGKKLGNLLMSHALQRLLQHGKTKVYLEVGSRNSVAYNLYYSYGFRTVSQKHGFLLRLK